MGLGAVGRGRDLFQIVMLQGAGAPALHLLEVVLALYVAHKQQTLQRLYIGASGDHVHRHRDSGVVVVTKLGKDRFGVLAWLDEIPIFVFPVLCRLVSDLFTKGITFAKFFPYRLDDVVGVAVGLGEDQGLGHFLAAWKYLGQTVSEGLDDRSDLAGIDDVPIQLFG